MECLSLCAAEIVQYQRKQPPRGVLRKTCSDNTQQTCRRTYPYFATLLKSHFGIGATVNLLHISKTPFPTNTSGQLLLTHLCESKYQVEQFIILIFPIYSIFVVEPKSTNYSDELSLKAVYQHNPVFSSFELTDFSTGNVLATERLQLTLISQVISSADKSLQDKNTSPNDSRWLTRAMRFQCFYSDEKS